MIFKIIFSVILFFSFSATAQQQKLECVSRKDGTVRVAYIFSSPLNKGLLEFDSAIFTKVESKIESGNLKTLFSTQQEERQKESRVLFLTIRDRDAEIFVTSKTGNNDYEDGMIYECKP
ncbi:hypothetical protein WDK46_21100 [Escherichia coli]|uniref:hypothetical protein n=1 Tax=Escherichia coli TaxID=562 RepID=UPI0012D6911B|nr:hypothetical protein [Escherichia coli]EBS5210383.1 hypothetical protein [Salmonella enterica subsp. enterica serovar Heidelberg]EHF3410164.1 hypothetical protein [Salmonella enterica]EBW9439551.1 hypothetical protein [Salmonella enterica subsp. enterica serovar Heidelberg]EEQ6900678.1 hypothetical protein [Escherichia coli]EET2861018.1 hypothetical protein [Escherichia coli]